MYTGATCTVNLVWLIKNILENNQDKVVDQSKEASCIPEHENLRGKQEYYN